MPIGRYINASPSLNMLFFSLDELGYFRLFFICIVLVYDINGKICDVSSITSPDIGANELIYSLHSRKWWLVTFDNGAVRGEKDGTGFSAVKNFYCLD